MPNAHRDSLDKQVPRDPHTGTTRGTSLKHQTRVPKEAPAEMNLILLSGEYAKLHAGAMMAAVAASFDMPVNVFVSMEALPAFHRDPAIRATVRKGEVGRKLEESGGDDYLALLNQAKDFGDVTIYACSLVADLYGWTLEDLAPIFDDVMGVAGFLGKTATGTTIAL